MRRSTLKHGCLLFPEIVEVIRREQLRKVTRRKNNYLGSEVRHRREVQFAQQSVARIGGQQLWRKIGFQLSAI